jgi:hypothetical protein
MPESMIAAINSDVPTGRRMKGSETFIASFYRRGSALAPALAIMPYLLPAGG